MDKIKIEHFKRDYPNRDFPSYLTLSANQMENIRNKLCGMIGVHQVVDNLELLNMVFGSASKMEFNALDEGFKLKNVFDSRNIRHEENVFIDWYRFDDIDQIGFDDLNEYLDDLWYPGAEDITIFDSKISWILFISHNGDIFFVDFSKKVKGPALEN